MYAVIMVKDGTMNLVIGIWVDTERGKMKPKTRRTELLFRVKCIMKKCREKGKWDLLARLCYKYEMTTVGESYYD